MCLAIKINQINQINQNWSAMFNIANYPSVLSFNIIFVVSHNVYYYVLSYRIS